MGRPRKRSPPVISVDSEHDSDAVSPSPKTKSRRLRQLKADDEELLKESKMKKNVGHFSSAKKTAVDGNGGENEFLDLVKDDGESGDNTDADSGEEDVGLEGRIGAGAARGVAPGGAGTPPKKRGGGTVRAKGVAAGEAINPPKNRGCAKKGRTPPGRKSKVMRTPPRKGKLSSAGTKDVCVGDASGSGSESEAARSSSIFTSGAYGSDGEAGASRWSKKSKGAAPQATLEVDAKAVAAATPRKKRGPSKSVVTAAASDAKKRCKNMKEVASSAAEFLSKLGKGGDGANTEEVMSGVREGEEQADERADVKREGPLRTWTGVLGFEADVFDSGARSAMYLLGPDDEPGGEEDDALDFEACIRTYFDICYSEDERCPDWDANHLAYQLYRNQSLNFYHFRQMKGRFDRLEAKLDKFHVPPPLPAPTPSPPAKERGSSNCEGVALAEIKARLIDAGFFNRGMATGSLIAGLLLFLDYFPPSTDMGMAAFGSLLFVFHTRFGEDASELLTVNGYRESPYMTQCHVFRLAARCYIDELVRDEEFRLFTLSDIFLEYAHDKPEVFAPLTTASLVGMALIRKDHRLDQNAAVQQELGGFSSLCCHEEGKSPVLALCQDGTSPPAMPKDDAELLCSTYLDHSFFTIQFRGNVSVKSRAGLCEKDISIKVDLIELSVRLLAYHILSPAEARRLCTALRKPNLSAESRLNLIKGFLRTKKGRLGKELSCLVHGGAVCLAGVAERAADQDLQSNDAVMYRALVINSRSKPADVQAFKNAWIYTATQYFEATGIDVNSAADAEDISAVVPVAERRSAADFM